MNNGGRGTGAAMDTARQILELQTDHRRLLWEKKISSPIAVGILEQLFYTPTVSIAQIAERFNVSYKAASIFFPLTFNLLRKHLQKTVDM